MVTGKAGRTDLTLMPNPEEIEQSTESSEQQAPIDTNEPATPEELGVGNRQSNEPFSPIDFDSIIDKASAGLPGGANPLETSKPNEEAAPANEEGTDGDKGEESDGGKGEESKDQAPKEELKEASAPKEEEKKEAPPVDVEIEEISKIEKQMNQHTSPKTKELFNQVKKVAAAERTEREKLAKELAELKKQSEQKQAESGKLPKEVEEEINQLRDRVRQFDANADPAIVAKYDKRIESNNESIIKTLVDAGLPTEHAEKLKKSGVTLSNLKQYLDTLDTGKGADGKQYEADPDTAEKIRESLRENMRLSKDKEREISEWRANYDQRTKQAEETQKRSIEEATARLNTEFNGHISKWDFLKKPADILETDAPAIRKEKEAAIKTFNEQSLAFADAIKKETSDPLNAQIAARVGILYRDLVAPQLKNQLGAAQKEIETLRAQISTMKKAGATSRTIGSGKPSATSPKKEYSGGEGFDDIIDSVAAQAMEQRQSQ
jgi:hypothetical protein